MKVFWSWQSDTPGETGRHLIREALERAIEKLKLDNDVTEADRGGLHLDHDRKGLSGSPDLAPAILGKIRASHVFVADVTSIGVLSLAGGEDKKVINSNVAIELGFAAGSIGDDKILMIQNTFYGTRNDLPFDLRGKAGPVQYELSPNSNKEERARVGRSLTAALRQALTPFVASPLSSIEPPLPPLRRLSLSSSDFEGADHLAMLDDNSPDRRMARFDGERAVYVRFVPTEPAATPLTSARTLELAQLQRLALIDTDWSPAYAARAPSGGTYFRIPPGERKRSNAASQIMPSGEMWALSALFFDRKSAIFNVTSLTEPLVRVLRSFHETHLRDLGRTGAATVEIGAFGLLGVRCQWSLDRSDGPFYHSSVSTAGTLKWTDGDNEREELVNSFIYRVVEEAGVRAKLSRSDGQAIAHDDLTQVT